MWLCATLAVAVCAAASTASADGVAPQDPQNPSCQPLSADVVAGQQATLTAECTDTSSASFTYALVQQPANGSATIDSGTGQITYAPNGGFTGIDTFTYDGTTSSGTSAPATVTVTVNPFCQPLSISTGENEQGSVSASCTDTIDPTFTGYAIVQQATNGLATVDSSGLITYAPSTGYVGPDSFTYDATTTSGTSMAVTVSVTVNPPPACQPLSISADENASGTGAANCTDSAGAPFTSYAILQQPAHGAASVDGSSGQITYTPASGYTGPDSLTYDATTSNGTSDSATVTVNVAGPPSAQIAAPADNQTYKQGERVPTTFSCARGGSGPAISSCVDSNGASDATGGSLDTSTPGAHTYTVTATSQDGQTGSAIIAYKVSGPPSVSISTPIDAAVYFWESIPGAGFSCMAGDTGLLASCVMTVDGTTTYDQESSGGTAMIHASAVPLIDSIGSHTVAVTATDTDGQSSTQTVTYISSLTLVPLVSAQTPTQGATYTLGQVVKAQYACVRAKNGPAITSCGGTVANGQPVPTGTLGKRTFTVTAKDAGGQSNSVQIPYTVIPTTNRFNVAHVTANRRGTAQLSLKLPGPGTISAVASAWSATGSKAMRRHFVYAVLRRTVTTAGVVTLRLSPNARGRALLRTAKAKPVISVAVTYTPKGAKPHMVRARLLRVS
jgi:hypothetical protein